MTHHSDTIKKLFHDYAEGFDALYGPQRGFIQRWINRHFRQSMRLRFEKTIQACQPVEGKRILDVGCGPGHYSVLLAKNGAESVVGLDVAPRMIELAKSHAQKQNLHNVCVFLEEDVMNYHPIQPFDLTVVMGVMDYILEPQFFLQHLQSLTKGKILLSFPNSYGILAWQRRWRYRLFANCTLNMYSEEKLITLLNSIAKDRFQLEPIERDFFVVINS